MENRTLRILEAIVDEYIRTGEAVGSKLIAEKLDNAVSSATIRNEMAALEQQGYLEHTHTSSGRLPTYQGLRLYIERVMSPAQLPDEEKEEIDRIFDNIGGATDDEIIDNASRACGYYEMCDSFYQHRKQVFGNNKGRRYPHRQKNVCSSSDNLRGQYQKQGMQAEL